jgi:phage baseplate assembly protein W
MATKTTYRGIAFPFGKSTSSFPAKVTDAELVAQSIQQIILTSPGERVMRPDFGCNAYAFVFENNDVILEELIRTEVTGAIGRYEPRAIVQSVSTERDASSIIVTIKFIVSLTGEQATVSIPITTNQEAS